MRRLLLPLLAMLFFAPGLARAESAPMPPASFDCTKAPGVDEHVICSDPLLRQADHDLAAAYKAARLVATDKARLRADEHGWVIQRDQECGIDKFTIVTDANRPRFVDCFLDEYDERMGDLQQMKLHPTEDPASISHPIRKSFDIPATVKSKPIYDMAILPGYTVTAFTWELIYHTDHYGISDPIESLLALAISPDGSGGLYSSKSSFSPTSMIQTTELMAIPKPHRFTALCVVPNGDIVLSIGRHGPFGIVTKSHYAEVKLLSSVAQTACNLEPDQLTIADAEVGDVAWNTLNFGQTKTGTFPDPRFVTINTPQGTKIVEPPIRIDSRTHFIAQAEDGEFFLYQDTWPAGMNEIVERRWAKTNCEPYYRIQPNAARALVYCIPFGPYSITVPHPIGLAQYYSYNNGDMGTPLRPCPQYFYAAGFGILTENGQPTQWSHATSPVAAPIPFPFVLGCSIAYFDPPGTLRIMEVQ